MCPYCISLKQKIALWGCNINACKKMKKTHLAVWLHTGISISTQTVHDNSPFMCRPKLALTGPACHQGPPNDPRPTTRAGSLRRRRMPRTESYRRSCNQRPQELWETLLHSRVAMKIFRFWMYSFRCTRIFDSSLL